MATTVTRRAFVTLLGGIGAWPLAALAQQTNRVRRVVALMHSAENDPAARSFARGLHEGLGDLGWKIGSDLAIDYRWGAGEVDVARAAAAELLNLPPDVIVADGGPALGELRRVARSVPIVFIEIDQPVFYGFVESLAHPGGNMTGFTGLEPSVGATWLELIKSIAPRTTRVAVMFNPRTAPGAALFSRAAEGAAPAPGVDVVRSPVYTPADIEATVTMLAREPGGGLILPVDTFTTAHREMIFELADRGRLPAIYGDRSFAGAGGLASYGIDLAGQLRQAAGYVDRILRGEKPGDLPVQPATKFELVVNLKAAKSIGLTIPKLFLSRTDDVIE